MAAMVAEEAGDIAATVAEEALAEPEAMQELSAAVIAQGIFMRHGDTAVLRTRRVGAVTFWTFRRSRCPDTSKIMLGCTQKADPLVGLPIWAMLRDAIMIAREGEAVRAHADSANKQGQAESIEDAVMPSRNAPSSNKRVRRGTRANKHIRDAPVIKVNLLGRDMLVLNSWHGEKMGVEYTPENVVWLARAARKHFMDGQRPPASKHV